MALELNVIIDEDWQWRMENLPEFATATGDHRYDDRLDDRSLAGYAHRLKWAQAVLDRLAAWNKTHGAAADADARVSARLLQHHCSCVATGAQFQTYLMPMNRLEGPHTELPQLVSYMRFRNVTDYRAYLARLKLIPTQLAQVTDLMREGIAQKMLPPGVGLESVLDQLAATEEGLVAGHGKGGAFWRDCPSDNSNNSNDPNGKKGYNKECKVLEDEVAALLRGPVRQAFGSLRRFVESKYLPAIAAIRQGSVACLDLPNGPAMYDACLKFHTGSHRTAEDIHATGLAEVERVGRAMAVACEACGMPSGGDVGAFLAALKLDPQFTAPSEHALVAKYRDVCMGIYPNLPKLFSIQCMPRTPFAVVATPEAQAAAAPAAYYLGGSGDGTRPGTFFVNTSNLASRPTYEAEALALHEGIPGHHTQTMLAGENVNLPHFRRFMDDRRYSEAPARHPIDGAFIEGWGLYAESLGAALGCYQDPYMLIGRLSAELFRSCRLVVDTGLHSKGWSVEQAKAFMAKHTAASEGNIDAEVKRYCTWPGQAVGYKVGELEIWRLRKRFESVLGDKADVKVFHELVLLNGSLPLSVIEELVEEHLTTATSKAKEGGGGATAAASQADSQQQQQQSVAFGEGLKLGLGLVALSAALTFAIMRPRASAAR